MPLDRVVDTALDNRWQRRGHRNGPDEHEPRLDGRCVSHERCPDNGPRLNYDSPAPDSDNGGSRHEGNHGIFWLEHP